jgi:hypothetical protein
MIFVTIHLAAGHVRNVQYPIAEACEINIFDYDKKKYSYELTDKDPEGNLCKHTIWGKERKDITHRVSVFIRDGKVAKVHLNRNVELTVKYYKRSTGGPMMECDDTKIWRIKD